MSPRRFFLQERSNKQPVWSFCKSFNVEFACRHLHKPSIETIQVVAGFRIRKSPIPHRLSCDLY